MTINGTWATTNVSAAAFSYGSKYGFSIRITPSGTGRWYWYANGTDDTYTADAEL